MSAERASYARAERVNFASLLPDSIFDESANMKPVCANIVVLLTTLLSGLPSGKTYADDSRPPQPSFVVIFCDNLGYGDIQPFGSEVHSTPNLNRMAAEGRRFTHFCVTAGVCTPSRASLLTGCYAQRVGMHWNDRDGHVLRPVSPYGLAPSEVTIAEHLQQLGYATACVGKWHLGDQPQFLPTRQGFDEFFGIPYSDDMTAEVGQRLGDRLQGNSWPPLPLMQNEEVIEAPVDRNELTVRCTEAAVDFIRRQNDQPFFLYFAQPMPGSTAAPFASEAFRGKSRNGAWGDAIEEIDWSTGQILDALRNSKQHRNTLVIWLSDNGAPLAKDIDSVSRGSNQPLHGRGYTTSEGAFRSPTLMWWPGVLPAGSTCDQLSTTMDLLPTLTRLAGRKSPLQVDGHDIRPLIFGTRTAQSPYRYFFYYYTDQLQAVRKGPWKLFVPLESFSRHPHFSKSQSDEPLLFHLYEDPSCKHNVAVAHPEIVAELLQEAESARQDLGDQNRPGAGQRGPGKIEGKPSAIREPRG
ncbi:MAG: sulfatase [Fuerstiella sp.]